MDNQNQGAGERALVYIDATGGGCEVNTSGPVNVLVIDFGRFETDPDYDVEPAPEFLEAFPFLAGNLAAARARRGGEVTNAEG